GRARRCLRPAARRARHRLWRRRSRSPLPPAPDAQGGLHARRRLHRLGRGVAARPPIGQRPHPRPSRAGVLRGARPLLGKGVLARVAPHGPVRRLAHLSRLAAAPLGLARPEAPDLPPLDRLVLIAPPPRPDASLSSCVPPGPRRNSRTPPL